VRLVMELSRPGGVLHLIYETPGEGHAAAVADTVTAALARHDLAASVTTAGVPSLICITANLEGDS
jgi:hypothetical protein